MKLEKISLMALSLLLLFGCAPLSIAMEIENQDRNQKRSSLRINCFNYAKSKTASALRSIYKTIKSDLGLELQKQDEPYSLVKDVGAACRLVCYSWAAKKAVLYLASKLISLDAVPTQFKSGECPSVFGAVIAGPLIEEMIFTYGISNILGSKYGPIVTPLIFGACHYNENPKRWALDAALCAAPSFFRTRHFHSKKLTLAPIFSHAMTNAVAYYHLFLKK
jgi:hypothetical protein